MSSYFRSFVRIVLWTLPVFPLALVPCQTVKQSASVKVESAGGDCPRWSDAKVYGSG